MKKTKAGTDTLAQARKDIQEAIDSQGSFRHNWVSSILRCVHNELGQAAANALIDEFDLTSEFGIRKLP